MYWAIGGAVAVGLVGVYAWLSSEEQSAYNDYCTSSRRVYKQSRQRQQQLRHLRKNNQLAQDYYKHIELHYQAVQTANACYEIYNQHKQILNMLYKKKKELGICIRNLKEQRNHATAPDKKVIINNLQIIRQYFQEVKDEIEKVKQEKEKQLQQVRQLNQATREFKLYIKDNCGKKGRDWYQRRLNN